jgi:hypothetical protein
VQCTMLAGYASCKQLAWDTTSTVVDLN